MNLPHSEAPGRCGSDRLHWHPQAAEGGLGRGHSSVALTCHLCKGGAGCGGGGRGRETGDGSGFLSLNSMVRTQNQHC